MNLDIIKNKIGSGVIGKEIVFLEEVDSTNTYAKNIEKNAVHGTVVIAESQNSGKGRHGKSWISPPGVGIWMSIILKTLISVDEIVKVPSMISLAVREGIEKSIGLQSLIKWPNDILINKKKVAGILIESTTQNNTVDNIVVGIGVNANQNESFFKDIPWATSISIEKGQKIEREEIVGNILVQVENYYNEFLKTKTLDLAQLQQNSVLINNTVRVLFDNEEIIGEVTGFKDDGSILIKSEGKVININSLKVSIRGMNGYVD